MNGEPIEERPAARRDADNPGRVPGAQEAWPASHRFRAFRPACQLLNIIKNFVNNGLTRTVGIFKTRDETLDSPTEKQPTLIAVTG